jgi:hypothetical protein
VNSGTIQGSNTSNVVTVLWGNTPGAFSLSVQQSSSTCGTVNSPAFAVEIQQIPAPSVSGPTSVCSAQGGYVYSVSTTAGHSYNWAIAGGTITNGQGTTTITVSWNTVGNQNLTITETSLNCGSSSSTYAVTVNQTPTPSIVGSNMVCSGVNQTYTVATIPGTYAWTISGGSIVSGQGTNSVTVRWLNNGSADATGTLTINQNNAGCLGSSTVNVTVQPVPAPAISGTNQACVGEEITYLTPGVVGHTYTWTVNGGDIIAGQGSSTISVRWTGNGANSISVQQASANCGSQTANYTVNVAPIANPMITGNASVCSRATGEVYQVMQIAGHTYNWTVQNGTFTGQGTNSITVNWDSSGTGSVSIEQSSPSCGIGSSTLTVSIQPIAVPVISGATSLCENTTSAQYSVAPITNGVYVWTVNGGTIVSGQGTTTLSVNWGSAGTGSVTIDQSQSGCASAIASVNVDLSQQPAPSIVGTTATCNEATQTYSVASVAGHTYQWEINGGTIVGSSVMNMVTVQWTRAGIGSLTLRQTSATCGAATTAVVVTVAPLANPDITGAALTCSGDFDVYSVTSVTGHTYQWEVIGGTIQTGENTNSIRVAWDKSGVHEVRVLQSSPTCNAKADTLRIEARPTPNPIVSGPAEACSDAPPIVYSTTRIQGHTYTWTVQGGIFTGQGTNRIRVQWTTPGNGRVSLVEASPTCSSDTASVAVAVASGVAPTVTGSDTVCANTTEVYEVPNLVNTNYTWTVQGGTFTGQGTNQINVTWDTSASGSVTVFQQSSNGCENTSTVTITVLDPPAVTVTGPTEVCEDDESVAYQVPAVAGVSYSWAVSGNGTIVTGGNTTNSIEVTWDDEGAGFVAVLVTGTVETDNCPTFDTLDVTVAPLPTPTIDGENSVCANSEGVQYSVGTSTSNFTWNVQGGAITDGQNTPTVTITWGATGTGSVSVVEESEDGCEGESVFDVTILELPSASLFVAPNVINQGDQVEFNVVASNGAGNYQYAWTSEPETGGLSNTSTPNPTAVPSQDSTEYTVVVTDAEGCSVTKTVQIIFGETVVSVDNAAPAPVRLQLSTTRPAPVTERAEIEYVLPTSGDVYLHLIDVYGRSVVTLVNEFKVAGTHTVTINALDMPSGTYFAVLRSANNEVVQQIKVVK